jgi:hypothetical protein
VIIPLEPPVRVEPLGFAHKFFSFLPPRVNEIDPFLVQLGKFIVAVVIVVATFVFVVVEFPRLKPPSKCQAFPSFRKNFGRAHEIVGRCYNLG